MSDAVGRELPGLDTFPGLVLALTALSGELPAALVSRLPASDTYKEYAVKQLKRDHLLRTFYRNGVRGLRLTTTASTKIGTIYYNSEAQMCLSSHNYILP